MTRISSLEWFWGKFAGTWNVQNFIEFHVRYRKNLKSWVWEHNLDYQDRDFSHIARSRSPDKMSQCSYSRSTDLAGQQVWILWAGYQLCAPQPSGNDIGLDENCIKNTVLFEFLNLWLLSPNNNRFISELQYLWETVSLLGRFCSAITNGCRSALILKNKIRLSPQIFFWQKKNICRKI